MSTLERARKHGAKAYQCVQLLERERLQQRLNLAQLTAQAGAVAVKNVEIEVTLRQARAGLCYDCGGIGRDQVSDDPNHACASCGGSGWA